MMLLERLEDDMLGRSKDSSRSNGPLSAIMSTQAQATYKLLQDLLGASQRSKSVKDLFKQLLPVMKEILTTVMEIRGDEDPRLSQCYRLLQTALSELLNSLENAKNDFAGLKPYWKVLSHRKRMSRIQDEISAMLYEFYRNASSLTPRKDPSSTIFPVDKAATSTLSFEARPERRMTTSVGTMTEFAEESELSPTKLSVPPPEILSEDDVLHVRRFLRSRQPYKDIKQMVAVENVTLLIDFLQQELDQRSEIANVEYLKRATKCLLYMSKTHGLVPTSFTCHDIMRSGKHPVWGGGFADIWEGELNGKKVCIKVLRLFAENSDEAREKIIKSFCREALVWKNLYHPNVLPFLGVSHELFYPSFCLISPWMKNGNIMRYLSQNPAHDRLRCVTEVAEGIAYLHSLDPPIVHADIRGANILVTDDFHCCLADFGLALAVETQAIGGSTASIQGSLRWLSPETLDVRLFDLAYITARDIYAFACTIIEVYTGRPPFADVHSDAAIIHEVLLLKNLPRRPEHDIFTKRDDLWDLVRACMSASACDRPDAQVVLRQLIAISITGDAGVESGEMSDIVAALYT